MYNWNLQGTRHRPTWNLDSSIRWIRIEVPVLVLLPPLTDRALSSIVLDVVETQSSANLTPSLGLPSLPHPTSSQSQNPFFSSFLQALLCDLINHHCLASRHLFPSVKNAGHQSALYQRPCSPIVIDVELSAPLWVAG